MSATPSLLSIALLGSLVLSGCALPGGDVGKSFDVIDAPTWEAGYSWTYDLVASSQMSGFSREGLGNDGDSERGTVTMTVLNTTKAVEGEPVYVLSLGEGFDHPLFDGSTQALTKKGLELVAIGHDQYYYSHETNDPCMGSAPLQPVDGEQQFPTIRFPLDDGSTWTGSIGIEEDFGMQYTMIAHGLVDVETPAGPFKAVYVTTDFKPQPFPDGGPEGIGMYDFSLRSEQWYSPDVQYLVKHVFTASASASEGGERYQFAYRTTAVLSDYSLDAAPEQPVPEILDVRQPSYIKYTQGRIVSDTAFPVNVADGPATVRLTLEETSRGRVSEEQIPQVSTLKPLTYDNETHEIGWTVTQYAGGYTEEEQYTGDILELDLSKGGQYQIRAALQPKKCGATMIADAYGTLSTYWTKTYELETATGDLPRTFELGDVPVEGNAYEARVSWVRAPKAGYSPDQANLVIRSPDGRTESYQTGPTGETSINTYPAGLHEVAWQTSGLPSVGEVVEVTVTVTYGYIAKYH
ncbi:MAG TPA: hypothetical protein VGB18_07915 [Candidatus Thermoplasmatota archaeon]